MATTTSAESAPMYPNGPAKYPRSNSTVSWRRMKSSDSSGGSPHTAGVGCRPRRRERETSMTLALSLSVPSNVWQMCWRCLSLLTKYRGSRLPPPPSPFPSPSLPPRPSSQPLSSSSTNALLMKSPVIRFSSMSFSDERSSRRSSASASGVRPRILVPARASDVTVLPSPSPGEPTRNRRSGEQPTNSLLRTLPVGLPSRPPRPPSRRELRPGGTSPSSGSR
mmetsp:Transcript_12399/g.29281  ORF Transcript_12399/g.29281 Transcript_12399/m.29281 type:complete len:222 (-) Transcript_12399:228-893(-)